MAESKSIANILLELDVKIVGPIFGIVLGFKTVLYSLLGILSFETMIHLQIGIIIALLTMIWLEIALNS